MRGHLASKDVQEALNYYAKESQADYEVIFTGLIDRLPQIAAGMQDITMIYANHGFAKYRIKRFETQGGAPY